MTDTSNPTPAASIPDDDLKRDLVVADADSPDVLHLSLAGDTYSMLITGDQTNGRYCLIDMHVPPGGGPPLHRHDFEEMFTLLDGSVDFFFRGTTTTVSAGSTVNIPANAPHHFRNNSDRPVRMLCMCTPAGQDEYFIRCADRVNSRTAPPPDLSQQEQDERRQCSLDLAGQYATELLPDDGR
jgi:quercetin dioxygenase-like cupin family protein